MNPQFGTVTIVGVGLLGGSLGLALKERGLATAVLGVGHRPSTLATAKEVGAVDETFTNVREAARRSDMIVLCTPAALVAQYLDEIRDVCSPHVVVTDVASTKGEICEYAHATWPHPLRVIGSHPMAGSEKFGPGHARADLYDGSVTFVEEGPDLDAEAYDRVHQLWTAVGSRCVSVDPIVHDRTVARTSHIPHVAAAAVALVAAASGTNVVPFVGKGFRDATRIAGGRPEIWRDICLTNATAIENGLDALIDQLQEVRRAVHERDGKALDEYFAKGVEARDAATGQTNT